MIRFNWAQLHINIGITSNESQVYHTLENLGSSEL